MSNIISVGALYDTTGKVTGYSNTSENLDIFAPADPVYTTDIVGSISMTAIIIHTSAAQVLLVRLRQDASRHFKAPP
jgi:hypothetical protein